MSPATVQKRRSASDDEFTKLAHDRNLIVTDGFHSATMDIDALHSTLLSITVASEKLRSARKSLPMLGDARSGVGKSIYEVENDLRIAKGTLAAELGFSLCPRCWPPELVAADRQGRINCPVCGQVSCEEAA
jgi:hypothetical protein